MPVYDKPFLTYEQQIDLLRNRGLLIGNKQFAISALSTISYYDLINRYKSHFMNDDGCFISGVTLEYLYNFFLFDKDIQSLILKYSVLSENIFKTKLSHSLAKYLGVSISEYLNSHNYQSNIGNLRFIDISTEIRSYINSDSVKDPTKHYKLNHNHIPPWILLKNISLGNAINLFRLLDGEAKHDIAQHLIDKDFPFPMKVGFITNCLNAIRLFRNSAAHNLNFTDLRINSRYRPAPRILYAELGTPILKRKNKKVIFPDRQALSGIYGCMLSILVLLNDDFLRSKFIVDFLSSTSISADPLRQELYPEYAKITQMPLDISYRFTKYYQVITSKSSPGIYNYF